MQNSIKNNLLKIHKRYIFKMHKYKKVNKHKNIEIVKS
jgi:hypothetical protein